MDRQAQHMSTPASSSLIGRWLSARVTPFTAPDSAELDLGYESALPWFAEADAADGMVEASARDAT